MERPDTHLKEIIATIVRSINPHKIYLFGSQSRGDTTPESDIDLVVIADLTGSRRERNRHVRQLFRGRTFGLDVFVFNPEEFERQRKLLSSISYTADKEGQVLYERA